MMKRISRDIKKVLGCGLIILSGIVSADERQTDLMFKILEEQRQEVEDVELNQGELDGGIVEPTVEVARPSHERLDPDVRRTWDRAVVYLPGRRFTTLPAKVDVTTPHTVVLYLHGCVITDHGDRPWARFIADQGFIVVMPDSYARKYRPSNCDGKTHSSGFFPLAHILRLEEIVWARHMLSKMPWADENNLFLMGHSEGGYAVNRYGEGGFRGIIISGYNCGRSWANWKVDTPAIAVNYESDPWFKHAGSMRCADNISGRSIKDVILSGHGHETYFRAEARDAVRDFIKSNEYRQ